MADVVKPFLRDDRGLESVENGIVAGLIVGGLVLALAAIGLWTNAQYFDLAHELQGAAIAGEAAPGQGSASGRTGSHGGSGAPGQAGGSAPKVKGF